MGRFFEVLGFGGKNPQDKKVSTEEQQVEPKIETDGFEVGQEVFVERGDARRREGGWKIAGFSNAKDEHGIIRPHARVVSPNGNAEKYITIRELARINKGNLSQKESPYEAEMVAAQNEIVDLFNSLNGVTISQAEFEAYKTVMPGNVKVVGELAALRLKIVEYNEKFKTQNNAKGMVVGHELVKPIYIYIKDQKFKVPLGIDLISGIITIGGHTLDKK